MLTADLWSPVIRDVGPRMIGLVCTYLVNLEAKSTPLNLLCSWTILLLKLWFVRPSPLPPLLRGPVLILTCPLLALKVADRGQPGHRDWSIHHKLSFRTSINLISSFSYSSSFFGSDHRISTCINGPWLPMNLSPVHHCFFPWTTYYMEGKRSHRF